MDKLVHINFKRAFLFLKRNRIISLYNLYKFYRVSIKKFLINAIETFFTNVYIELFKTLQKLYFTEKLFNRTCKGVCGVLYRSIIYILKGNKRNYTLIYSDSSTISKSIHYLYKSWKSIYFRVLMKYFQKHNSFADAKFRKRL